MTSTITTEHDPYPARDETHYGRGTWAMGEDGDEGFMAEGHGRRALAAVNAYGRGLDGHNWAASLAVSVDQVWLLVVEDCGCSVEEHEQHAVREDPGMAWYDCDSCERWGLPPCRDDYGWMVETATADTVGALAFTKMSW